MDPVAGATHPTIRPLPFRIVIVDRFAGDAAPWSRPIAVPSGALDDVMRGLDIRLTLEVPNRLGSAPRHRTVDLHFAAMRDFRPKALVERVPELAAVAALHERLDDFRSGRIDRAQLEAGLDPVRGLDALAPALTLALESARPAAPEHPPGTPPPADPAPKAGVSDLVDELFEMVAVPGEEQTAPPEPTALDSAMAAIRGGRRRGGGPAAARAMEMVAAVLSRQVFDIVHTPEFRALERAWRTLQFVLAHAGGDGKVRIELLHTAPDAFAETYTRGVYEPECAGATEFALGLTVLGWPVGNNTGELQVLRAAQQQAEALQAPILWSMDASFLGSPRQLEGREQVRTLLDSDELAKWRGLREDEAARWSAACFNRFLLRAPYGDGQPTRLPIVEDIADPDQHLWGAPSCFVAALIARSVAETGWPTGFGGMRSGAIAARPIVDGKPVEACLSESTVEDLASGGIMALTCVRDRDEALLLRTPSVHAPARFGTREEQNAVTRGESALPFQLLAARLAETTLAHKAELVGDGDPAGVQQRFELFLRGLVGDTGGGADAAVALESDPDDDAHRVHCSIRTGRQVLGGAVVQFTVACQLDS